MVEVRACVCVGVTSIGVLDAEVVLGHHTIFARRRDREVKISHGMAAATWWDGQGAIFCENALGLVLGEEPGLESLCLDEASRGGCIELVKAMRMDLGSWEPTVGAGCERRDELSQCSIAATQQQDTDRALEQTGSHLGVWDAVWLRDHALTMGGSTGILILLTEPA